MKYANFLSENIGLQIMKFPISKHEVTDATGNFLQKLGFHQAISCIDGTTYQPNNQVTIFLPRWTIQPAVSDACGKFINVEVKRLASVNDAKVIAKIG